jgi:DNA protecting protein DprA
MLMTPGRRKMPPVEQQRRASGYFAPPAPDTVWLRGLLLAGGRGPLTAQQLDIFQAVDPDQLEDIKLYYAGDISLLSHRCVSIVGTREASEDGRARADRLARELAQAGVVVVSGLARGIDAAAHGSAIRNGGRTIAVIGTPLSKASPFENAELQEQIWRDHLLITPFREGATVFRSNFPQRNRVMAAISDATVIVEASDTSGTLHQAAECQRLGRWLFILRSVVDHPNVSWPGRFLAHRKTAVIDRTDELLSKIASL